MKKLLIAFVLCSTLLTGCEYDSDRIYITGRTDNSIDDININLRNGWFVNGYSIDYESKTVTLQIEKVIDSER